MPSRNAVIVTVQSVLPNSGASSNVNVEMDFPAASSKASAIKCIVFVAANLDFVCVILAVVGKLGFTLFSDQSV